MARRKTRNFMLGGVGIGSNHPVSVQSMTKTDTRDIEETSTQIRELAEAGCDIIRLAVVDEDAAKALGPIRKASAIPIIADIHFDYKLALTAMEAGVDGLRINPGNIGSRWKVEEVVKSAEEKGIPIRVGVNSGSVEREFREKFGGPTVEAMVESGLSHIRILEDLNFRNVKVSLKATDVERTLDANRLFASKTDIPLHLGVTEAGTVWSGSIKSSVGLGILLGEGIGDTIRVSLTGHPVEEVRVGWQILKSLELRYRGVNIISCPTCGRLEIPIEDLCHKFEAELTHIEHPFNLAIMGCVVNGPGESTHADIGIVAHHSGDIRAYKDGKFWQRIPFDDLVPVIRDEFERKWEEIKAGKSA
ncbi:MAG: flavodoxin-dependent (E)-4-hydroxy-3-methylbut-2-enyl-diphosphate synthase [Deltaproteobacteria bacterium]|nr:flavodoxin-dependent (E)-4-hydroxy-3-methylbut-2-enyl-diphosphate synthase [Deltaproteobacteria bacterium]